jgi:hypothetical protein
MDFLGEENLTRCIEGARSCGYYENCSLYPHANRTGNRTSFEETREVGIAKVSKQKPSTSSRTVRPHSPVDVVH